MNKVPSPVTAKKLREAATELKKHMPKGVGFMIICYSEGMEQVTDGQYAGYISTGRREDCIKAIRECANALQVKMN